MVASNFFHSFVLFGLAAAECFFESQQNDLNKLIWNLLPFFGVLLDLNIFLKKLQQADEKSLIERVWFEVSVE